MVRSEGARGRACEREGRRGGRGKGGREEWGGGILPPLAVFFFLLALESSRFFSLSFTHGGSPPPTPQPRGGEGVADDARKGGTLFFVGRGVLSFDQTRQRKRPPAPAAGPRAASAYPPPASHRGRRREAAAHGGLSVAWRGVAERGGFHGRAASFSQTLAQPSLAEIMSAASWTWGGREGGGGGGKGERLVHFISPFFFFSFYSFPSLFADPPVSPSLFRFVRTVAMASALSSSSVISNFS